MGTGGFPNFGIHTLDAWRVPLYNTMILISSRFTLTYSYHTLCLHHHDESIIGQLMAIGQGFMFSYYQLWEYFECTFTISQGCWGSVFFMATGFHRMHVLIGTSFLIYNLYRTVEHEFSKEEHRLRNEDLVLAFCRPYLDCLVCNHLCNQLVQYSVFALYNRKFSFCKITKLTFSGYY